MYMMEALADSTCGERSFSGGGFSSHLETMESQSSCLLISKAGANYFPHFLQSPPGWWASRGILKRQQIQTPLTRSPQNGFTSQLSNNPKDLDFKTTYPKLQVRQWRILDFNLSENSFQCPPEGGLYYQTTLTTSAVVSFPVSPARGSASRASFLSWIGFACEPSL